jgi:alkyl sulfatase BDS1-like metallo-beta-lactamase superfamily hydrolase
MSVDTPATTQSTQRILVGEMAGKVIGDGLIVLPGQGNSLAAVTGDGVVLLDASGRVHAPKMIEALRQHTDAPVHAIIYSHGHGGYNSSVELWEAHAQALGEPAPRRIAHRNVLRRYDRYRETQELQARLNSMQFPSRLTVAQMAASMPMYDPSEVFDDAMVVTTNGRRIELFHAPSEVDDALAVWLPDDGLLAGGAATPGATIPNIGTPLRTQRLTIRWAETLDRLAALGAERLLTEFGPLIEGVSEVRQWLTGPAEALRWLRAEIVRRMNAGMGEREILADMVYPPALFDHPWMQPTYGAPDYIVRDIFREENGWWDRNPTNLHPAAPEDAALAVLSAVDPDRVLARARELADAGQPQLAMHVIDLIATGPDDAPHTGEARHLKAGLCRALAEMTQPYVSRALYRSSARLLDEGQASWTHLP